MSEGMLGRLPLSKVLRPVNTLLIHLGSKDGEVWLDRLNKLNREGPRWLPESETKAQSRPRQPKLLIPTARFTAEVLGEPFDPAKFFQTGDRIFVHPDFQKWILPVAKPTEAGATVPGVRQYKLGLDATGNDLLAARKRSAWKDTSEFCWWLANKIKKQLNGQEGELTKTGWLLSLVKGINGGLFVVGVYWRDVHGSWRVYAWDLADGWYAGHQLASRN